MINLNDHVGWIDDDKFLIKVIVITAATQVAIYPFYLFVLNAAATIKGYHTS
jgi:hypothetical protein